MSELPRYQESGAFSALEKLVITYAVEMTKTTVDVPDSLFEELRRHFNAAELVELTASIAWENYRARFNHALEIGPQGFSEAAYCALPERT